MAMRFTATVKNREVLIRDVPLSDGEVVDVTIKQQSDEWEWAEEELRSIERGEADIAAGRVRPLGEVLEKLGRAEELWYQRHGRGQQRDRSRSSAVGTTRPGTKPAARRARSRR